jgi:hypothetical protein
MRILQLIAEAYADGISRMMNQFLGDEDTLRQLKCLEAEGEVGILGVGGAVMLTNSSALLE